MSLEGGMCDLCGKSLIGYGGWIDDDRYGDVHVTCREQAEDGIAKEDIDPEAA